MPGFESLAAFGMTLVVAGVVLRGFAAQSRRELARRKQHRLDERKSSDAFLNEQLERPPTWLERNYGRVANAILLTGTGLTVFAFWRR